MKGTSFCFTHNPETKEEKKAAVSKGGRSPKRNFHPVETIEINTNKDVVKLITITINEVRQGIMDVRIANCIFYGSGQLIKALEVADLEERVVHLEERTKWADQKKF